MVHRSSVLITAVVLLVVASGCSSDVVDVNPTVVKTLSGRVVRSTLSTAGIANATVTCMGRVVVTDTAGYFTFRDLPMDASRTIIRVHAENYLRATQAFVPSDAVMANYVIAMQRATSIGSNRSPSAYVFWRGALKIMIPLDAFVTKLGAAYTGEVTGLGTSYDIGDNERRAGRLGDNGAVFADGSKGVLERTNVVRFTFLGADKDTVYVRPNTTCSLAQRVDVAPEFTSTMSIFTFDHGTAYWNVAGQATLDSNEYTGTFVWGNDVTMNFLNATRRSARIRVVDPDGRPIERCAVSLSKRMEYTDSTGVCSLQLVRSNGSIVDVRDATNTEILATYSMEGASEADPGEHTIVLPRKPVMLTGTFSYCENPQSSARVVLSNGSASTTFVVQASPFAIPIPTSPQLDVFAHNNGDVKSAIVRVTPSSVVGGVADVGDLSMCASTYEDGKRLPIPSGSIVISAACRRTTNGVFVITTNRLLTYNDRAELVASVPLSTAIGARDTSIWTSYVSSADDYIYVTNGRRVADYIEVATGRVVYHHEFNEPQQGLPAIGADPETGRIVYAFTTTSALVYGTYDSRTGQRLMLDSIARNSIGNPGGVMSASLYSGRHVLLDGIQWESSIIVSIDVDRTPRRVVHKQWSASVLSKGGTFFSTVGEDEVSVMLFYPSTERYLPVPEGVLASSFFTSMNDRYIGIYRSGQITVAEVATGRQTVLKHVLPPRMNLSTLDLSDNGTRLCVISGGRTSAKVLNVALD